MRSKEPRAGPEGLDRGDAAPSPNIRQPRRATCRRLSQGRSQRQPATALPRHGAEARRNAPIRQTPHRCVRAAAPGGRWNSPHARSIPSRAPVRPAAANQAPVAPSAKSARRRACTRSLWRLPPQTSYAQETWHDREMQLPNLRHERGLAKCKRQLGNPSPPLRRRGIPMRHPLRLVRQRNTGVDQRVDGCFHIDGGRNDAGLLQREARR